MRPYPPRTRELQNCAACFFYPRAHPWPTVNLCRVVPSGALAYSWRISWLVVLPCVARWSFPAQLNGYVCIPISAILWAPGSHDKLANMPETWINFIFSTVQPKLQSATIQHGVELIVVGELVSVSPHHGLWNAFIGAFLSSSHKADYVFSCDKQRVGMKYLSCRPLFFLSIPDFYVFVHYSDSALYVPYFLHDSRHH